MAQITLSDATHDRIKLLSRAWSLPDGAVIERLLQEFQAAGQAEATEPSDAGIPIHAIYQGMKTEALFDPETQRVTITSGPLAGKPFKSPSGAAVAVVRRANPKIRAERNGWGFWIVTATGEFLQSLR